MKKHALKKDLRTLGAGEHEAQRLTDLAAALSTLQPRGLSRQAKQRLAPDAKLAKKPLLSLPRFSPVWKLALGGGFASAAVLLLIAQSALPGSFLYPVKRKTEEARTAVQPDYNDVLLEKREEEVQQLKQQETVSPEIAQEAEQQYQQTAKEAVERWQKAERTHRGSL